MAYLRCYNVQANYTLAEASVSLISQPGSAFFSRGPILDR